MLLPKGSGHGQPDLPQVHSAMEAQLKPRLKSPQVMAELTTWCCPAEKPDGPLRTQLAFALCQWQNFCWSFCFHCSGTLRLSDKTYSQMTHLTDRTLTHTELACFTSHWLWLPLKTISSSAYPHHGRQKGNCSFSHFPSEFSYSFNLLSIQQREFCWIPDFHMLRSSWLAYSFMPGCPIPASLFHSPSPTSLF